MTLTLEIAPEIERALEAEARRAGVPVTDYALRVLAENVAGNGMASSVNTTDVAQARLAAWSAFVANAPNTRAGLPEIVDTSRTAEPDIYGYSEREAEQL